MLWDPRRDVKESETVTILRAARERIERGWCQGIGSIGHSFCALVALSTLFAPEDALDNEPLRLLRKAVGQERIIEWNDAPGRTKADVLEAFSRAIELAR
jgi:hypothetical protein